MRAREFTLEDNPDYDEDRYLKSDPGVPLNFPKGTTLVDVSDVYDWYKLGMAVSDLDDADPRTFNKGVPHTVFAFGSEEEEHKMIPLLKRLGFSLHDIDTPEDYEKAIRADEAIAQFEDAESTASRLGTQLYAPHPDSVNESIGLKPQVKVWTSTAIKTADGITSEWVRWCDAEMPEWIGDTGFLLDVAPAAKILTIRSDRDAVAVAQQYGAQFKNPIELMTKMPWAAIGRDYDAVHYTAENNWQDTIMRAWDVESTAWFNPGVLGNKRAVQLARNPEYLEEMAGEIHGGVRKALMAKGYQYLGGGIDKQAYLEPGTRQVLIVFGYHKNYNEFSPDQRMFINWITYCNKNSNNPHLPRFSGFESFQFRGKNYIQARMEALGELPDEVGMLVKQLSSVTSAGREDIKFYDVFHDIAQYATRDSHKEYGRRSIDYKIQNTINYLGGEKAAMRLLQTVQQVKKFAMQHGYGMDLHRGNYMQRPDGTIVVNDPFVFW